VDVQDKAGGTRRVPTPQAQAEFERELAHKLGNLLQVVNGNLELLACRIEDEQLRGYVMNAQTAAERLTELARELADPAEAESG
jgi:signal transduction histidine kinase